VGSYSYPVGSSAIVRPIAKACGAVCVAFEAQTPCALPRNLACFKARLSVVKDADARLVGSVAAPLCPQPPERETKEGNWKRMAYDALGAGLFVRPVRPGAHPPVPRSVSVVESKASAVLSAPRCVHVVCLSWGASVTMSQAAPPRVEIWLILPVAYACLKD
jgi:hypothetical protein